jgi:fructokinase
MACYALIEGGGTKINLGIADSSNEIIVRHRLPTLAPQETLSGCSDWFRLQNVELAAIGIAFFGPLIVDRHAADWGCIARTTKPLWSGVNVAGHFADALGCAVGIESDVDGAALGELKWGAGQGLASLLYLTVGTGIGGGFVTSAGLLRGLSHPEMGHIRMPRHSADMAFAGTCPFHGDCLEGLASGPAIIARWGRSLSELPADHPAHNILAWYLGQAIATYQAIMEPERIVIGGGVMQTPGLIERVRGEACAAGNGYFVGEPDAIIVPPGLGDDAGLMGALVIAHAAALG